MPAEKYEFLNMPWTIEKQLEAYANDLRHTDRHRILRNAWEQNREFLSKMLEYAVTFYPAYSEHNVTHCRAVLHNIECLLGEDEIKRLSPTDCFAILMTVYLHDVGMCITGKDREKIIDSELFSQMVHELSESPETELQDAAKILLKREYDIGPCEEGASTAEKDRRLFAQKMDVYYALTLLLSRHQRQYHAQVSAKRMEEWMSANNKMHSAFEVSGIPVRIFLQIAGCARMHQGESNVTLLMNAIRNELLECDNGFAGDKYHPRFIAILLMLGDILDIDNGRFSVFSQEFAGPLMNSVSKAHLRKHRSIRALQITPRRIEIRADCDQPDELRLLYADISWLQRFIKECSYYWSEIAPAGYCGCLPTVECPRIQMNGREIPTELVAAKFQISQKKAFRLLQGADLYKERMVFLRELLQNAVDAVKLQYWQEFEPLLVNRKLDVDLVSANNELPLNKFPVSIEFRIKKREKTSNTQTCSISAEDVLLQQEDDEKWEYGVEVSIQDCGIGISEEDLRYISQVGTSHEQRKKQIERMPQWLRPTGHFGIGLQSLFLIDNHFRCVTRTRTNECYDIVFHSGTSNEGYINVTPRSIYDDDGQVVPYGTKFTIFVNHNFKVSHAENMEGWAGVDPYSEEYEKTRSIRRSHELLLQMKDYLDNSIGERLFPLELREERLPELMRNQEWGNRLDWKSKTMVLRRFKNVFYPPYDDYSITDTPCWLFQKEDPGNEALYGTLDDNSKYYLDVEECKLYIWSQTANCFYCCSADRILHEFYSDESRDRGGHHKYGSIHMYLKGIYIQDLPALDHELIEYIDVKNDNLQKYLLMHRNALNKDGYDYLKTTIIPQLNETFYQVLCKLNEVSSDIVEKNRMTIIDSVFNEYEAILEEQNNGTINLKKASVIKKELLKLEASNFTYYAIQNQTDLRSGQLFRVEACSKCVYDKSECDESERGLVACFGKCFERVKRRLVGTLKTLQKDFPSVILERLEAQVNAGLDSCCTTQTLSEIRKHGFDIQRAILFYGMCYYYTNQVSNVLRSPCVRHNNTFCNWQYINKKIVCMLKEFSHKVTEKPSCDENRGWAKRVVELRKYLFIPVIEDGEGIKPISFAEIMSNNNHYAVFSTRLDPKDSWKHILFHLQTREKEERKDDVLKEISSTKWKMDQSIFDVLLNQVHTVDECEERSRIFNVWSEVAIRNYKNVWLLMSDNGGSPMGDRKEQFSIEVAQNYQNSVIQWMVRRLPTLAIASDEEGNNRLNILCRKSNEYVFYDSRMIKLIMNRMSANYQKSLVQRMRTTTWDGLERLNTDELVSTNILRVDRGKVSKANRKNVMLLAVQSTVPEAVKEKCQVETTYELLNKLPEYFENPEHGELDFSETNEIRHCWSDLVIAMPFGLNPLENRNDQRSWEELLGVYETYGSVAAKTSVNQKMVVDILTLTGLFKELRVYKMELEGGADENQKAIVDKWTNIKEQFSVPLTALEKELPEAMGKNNLELLFERIQIILATSLCQSYLGLLEDICGGDQHRLNQSEIDSWNKVMVPSDSEKYLRTAFALAMGVTFQDFKQENDSCLLQTESNFIEDSKGIYGAIEYLTRYAAAEYRQCFVNEALAWWKRCIFDIDSGKENFYMYNLKHTSVNGRQELEELCLLQIRRVIWSYVADQKSPVPVIQR